MNFKNTFEMLMDGKKLETNDAYNLMKSIGEKEFNDIQNAAIISILNCRDITLNEITGFRNSLLELSISPSISSLETIDLCGTGGDEKNTFNISTISAFIVAASGYKVTKHGNYGVSSISGSSNLLENIGYKFSYDSNKLNNELEDCNICFLHAPLFHPALKNVSTIRKELGVRTVFNILGPLVNPAKPSRQLVGVYNLKLARLYNYLLQQDGKDYVIVHSTDGYDEISLTSNFQYFSSKGEKVLRPEDLGMKMNSPESLFGGETLEKAIQIFKKIINNEGSDSQIQAVLANSGAAIQCFEKDKSLIECIEIARENLLNGNSKNIVNKLLNKQ